MSHDAAPSGEGRSSRAHHERRRMRSLSSMVDEARARQASKTKQPWFVLKMTVGIAAAIIAYSAYVYIGRLCIPMIKRERSSLGSRSMGIVFLVVFVLLGFMMVWAYIKVVFTPPGFAVDRTALRCPHVLDIFFCFTTC
ncbi:hypothetical protein BC834DRAFT_372374 [Gloeopeniophorella convolvens]|nr:hypothetical protein BC834DRAFT_372374 [Gloeopeniophorella convolvens]